MGRFAYSELLHDMVYSPRVVAAEGAPPKRPGEVQFGLKREAWGLEGLPAATP